MARRSKAAEWDAFELRSLNADREQLRFGALALGGGFGALFGGLLAGPKAGPVGPLAGAVIGAIGGYSLAGNKKKRGR